MKIDFVQLENIVQAPFHNRTLGIYFVTNIWLSTATLFFTFNGMIDDVIKTCDFW